MHHDNALLFWLHLGVLRYSSFHFNLLTSREFYYLKFMKKQIRNGDNKGNTAWVSDSWRDPALKSPDILLRLRAKPKAPSVLSIPATHICIRYYETPFNIITVRARF